MKRERRQRPQGNKTTATALPLCARCLHILTRTQEELIAAIEHIAYAAEGSGWSREIFIEKMTRTMAVGDEVAWVGIRAANIRRADGSIVSVYERDS
jgi:hypothetical protein